MKYEEAIKEIIRRVARPGNDDALVTELTNMDPHAAALLLQSLVELKGNYPDYMLVKTAFLAGAILGRAALLQ